MLLKIENLHVEVDGRKVLRGVDLTVQEGEVHVIVGPNGAGKSTLLYTIAGHPRYRIVQGRIMLDGEDISNLDMVERCRRGISLMHQIPPVIRTIRTSDLISAMMSKFRVPDYINDIAKILQVRDFMNRPLFYGLSGGERKRLELFLSVLQSPRLLMLDEPDSGVDIDSLDRIAESINILIDNRLTILLVTHRGDIIRKVKRVDKVHVMCDGRIVKSGNLDLLNRVLSEGFKTVC